ncbi:AAA family ATPase [Dactylosporangium sp. NBC_01737]|uniref:AAA family ATPase n=1 Tax=Dactylosporangium sp. NBC_01737 TaxID=2975959 RepID=UPI002E0E5343|nr:AAA family ATPase [Dactylosporangium sp. NBC_01737]
MTAALGLDQLSPSRKDGWKRLAEAQPRMQPDQLSRRQLRALDESARDAYARQRAVWHANLTVRTEQLAAIHQDLWDIIDSNCQDGDRIKGAVAIDAFPGLGKTTAACTFGRDLHRREIERGGAVTAGGHEHLPVCRIGLTSDTTMWKVNDTLLEFYGHPGRRGNAKQLASRALDCILSCYTKLIIIDDVHFLDVRRRDGVEVSNHFK